MEGFRDGRGGEEGAFGGKGGGVAQIGEGKGPEEGRGWGLSRKGVMRG